MPKTTGGSRPAGRPAVRRPDNYTPAADERGKLSARGVQHPLRTSRVPSTVQSSPGEPSAPTAVTLESHQPCFATVESLERENETLKAENEDLAQSLRALKEQYRGLTERVQKFAQEVQTLAAGWLPKDQAVTEPEGQMEPVISTMADMWATGEGDVFDISNDDELGQYLQFE